ncbi:4-hydroxythreonine-4-phosphate dehydrogenase PdxA [Parvularcula sp. LCG005]|uniref:4-hydroxythreonine-4-phosphate dehydrogenase PdxA n=1 Tax=Parvularcula sp. LCG005 TaxID=3078805 RepID=UPI002943D1A0|nr:4-hydroxythreonine-4-phosphate dehydrogenase PdxA [Parvularcula sp. LCG005]WOI52733.1 4-hydroxythreonine-4-phosphate dehydrogenase PdxA [Parvularcula sp. LCG005]
MSLSSPLAVSMGEPAGIGTEILAMAYRHFADMPHGKVPTFFLVDDPFRVERLVRGLGLDVPIATIASPSEATEQFGHGLPILPLPDLHLDALRAVVPGSPTPSTAGAVTASIDIAVTAALNGEACGVVTLPIQKQALQDAGFEYPGHTEYLGHLTETTELPHGMTRGPVMILTAGPFRVAPVTVHLPLKDVSAALTLERIVSTGMVLAEALVRDYGVDTPRIAVAGLNPHAGEQGHLGREEIDVIVPAIKALRDKGIDAMGPFPADTMFHEEARAQYHAALTMYHDQGLVPIKTIAFHAAVNTTLGLPIVRSSPDHGTALDVVGKKIARPDSLINAIYSAHRMAAARTVFDAVQAPVSS